MNEQGQVYFLSAEPEGKDAEDIKRYKQAIAAEIVGSSVTTNTNPQADQQGIVAQTCDDCGDSVIEPGQGTVCGSCASEQTTKEKVDGD